MEPLIGISTCVSFANDPKRSFNKTSEIHFIQLHYIDMVRNGGGLPVLLPITDDEAEINGLSDRLDGIVFTGGPDDLDPALYGEENTHSRDVNPRRDQCEVMYVHAMRKRGKPILGVCRGMQILNVALKGSIYQDIPTQIKNAIPHPLDENNKEVFHNIRFKGDSFLMEIFGREDLRINSSHHQSVKKTGEGLSIIAEAPDGVIEAIVHTTDRCTVGIQWHPERMQNEAKMISLIKWFIDQAR